MKQLRLFVEGFLGIVFSLLIFSLFFGDCLRVEYRRWRDVTNEPACPGDGGKP